MRYDPDDRAAQLAVRVADTALLPRGVLGWWQPERATIWLRAGMLQRQRRATLMHEVVHVERGDGTCTLDAFARKLERGVEMAAAVRLITLCQLGAALRGSWNVLMMAQALDVDVPLLRVRLEHARSNRRESAYLDRVAADIIDCQIGDDNAVG